MADQAGCTISELTSKLSSIELNLRLTNRMMQKGYTFDRQKQAEIRERERQEQTEAFLHRARSYWKGN